MTENLFDLEFYRVHRKAIEKWFQHRDRDPQKAERMINEYSVACGCHVIAAFTFYAEAFGQGEALQPKIDFLMKWYGFTGVRGGDDVQSAE